ncbi:hypothetical protein [Micromonospora sp. 15K316]|uniref:hypothetical protein n=1 Tax=Micromonospora sp. 15K316 TaxID=2530376 RepID=UPI001FB6338F|nr:hypothetical protein [Micromonospora sp. 15K316]
MQSFLISAVVLLLFRCGGALSEAVTCDEPEPEPDASAPADARTEPAQTGAASLPSSTSASPTPATTSAEPSPSKVAPSKASSTTAPATPCARRAGIRSWRENQALAPDSTATATG